MTDKTKLASSFPDSQFYIPGYPFPTYCKGRIKNEEGKIVSIREEIIAKKMTEYDGKSMEVVCLI